MKAKENAPGPDATETERRDDPRLTVDEEASVTVMSRGAPFAGRIVEISLSGCRLHLRDRFFTAKEARAEVSFKLRGMGFRCTAQVQWSDGSYLVGLRFVDVAARRMDELVEALAELAAEQAAKSVKQAAQRIAAREQARAGTAPSSDVLQITEPALDTQVPASLPKTADYRPQPPAVLPFHKPGASPQAGIQLRVAQANPSPQLDAKSAGKERRGQSRHQVDTSATILLVNVASRVHGRILNLSMGGCRVRTEQRFPVGIYTRVETEFLLEGLPFRLGGVIQDVQDRHHVGIRFLDMSERKREQLVQLIAEIEEFEQSR